MSAGMKHAIIQYVMRLRHCSPYLINFAQVTSFECCSALIGTAKDCNYILHIPTASLGSHNGSWFPGPEVIKLFSCSTQLSMKF